MLAVVSQRISCLVACTQVFRTNASYARWDEGRKMWGMVLNRTRDICRLVRGLAACLRA